MAWRRVTSNKFSAQRTEVDGIVFASKAEARRYSELSLLLKAGEIFDLELQPKYPVKCGGRAVLIRSKGYPNGRKASYIADFRYTDSTGRKVVEDVKGMDTPVSKLKRALVEAEYGIRVEIVR